MANLYPFEDFEERAIVITERIASVLSIIGGSFILITFFSSSKFRRPVNRLIFYAAWGNLLMNIGTTTSLAGIDAGQNSFICQCQGFLIQMFLPADALWNLSMAINVYLTVFKKYNAAQLRAKELQYILINYGLPFVVAFCYCFVDTDGRGKIYGPAILWCWVDAEWDEFRVGLCYGPSWAAILIAFGIYVMAGHEIYKKRRQLRSFRYRPGQGNPPVVENPFTSFKTTEIQVTSELAQRFSQRDESNSSQHSMRMDAGTAKNYEQYTIKIERGPRLSGTGTEGRLNKAAMEANAAAWGYTKCALLFFASMLITWVPSSLFRVYSLAHPTDTNFPLAYAASLVLPLMGFWNTVIYITTSWSAVCHLFGETLGLNSLFVRSGLRKPRPISAAAMARRREIYNGATQNSKAGVHSHRRQDDDSSLSESLRAIAV